jgi:hypothetical protein
MMIDDHSRQAYTEVLPTLTANCVVAFVRHAVVLFRARGGRAAGALPLFLERYNY